MAFDHSFTKIAVESMLGIWDSEVELDSELPMPLRQLGFNTLRG